MNSRINPSRPVMVLRFVTLKCFHVLRLCILYIVQGILLLLVLRVGTESTPLRVKDASFLVISGKAGMVLFKSQTFLIPLLRFLRFLRC